MKQLVSAISWLFLSTLIFSTSLVYAADFSQLGSDTVAHTAMTQTEIKAPVVYSFDNLQFSSAYSNPAVTGDVLGKSVLSVPEPSPEPEPTSELEPAPQPTPKPSPRPTLKPEVSPSSLPAVEIPTPSAQPAAPVDLEASFSQAESTYGVSAALLKGIAQCESGMRANAVNGPYLGMFQFLASTWSSNRRAMGADPDPALRANGHEAIMTAAFKISRDGIGAWPACGKKAMANLS